jgi:hypothetical protein
MLSASKVLVKTTVSVDPALTNFAWPDPSPVTVQRLVTESDPSAMLTPSHVPAIPAAVKGA